MDDTKKVRLSREEIAKIEIGHTDVSVVQKRITVGAFLAFIFLYGVAQFCYRQPFAEWRDSGGVKEDIKVYETAIEESSLLRKYLLAPAQRFLTGILHTGNEKVIVGKDGWLFYSGDFEYLVNPGFLESGVLHKRQLQGVRPDPVKAICDFQKQLAARGIRLIVVPVPVKPMIYSDKLGGAEPPLQNPSFVRFKHELEKSGVEVVDLAEDFAAMRKNGVEVYLKTDTHWTPEAVDFAARRIAEAIKGQSVFPVERNCVPVTNLGDIAAMLKLPDCEKFFPAETVAVADHKNLPSKDSEVLLLGDSFANIYSMAALKWGEDGGLAETLGAHLGTPVDAMLRNDAGAFATREMLARELMRGRDRLAGKKVVVYEFAIRELANGDWKMLDLTLRDAPETSFLEIDSPRCVTATVLDVSSVPRPNSAPYADHVMSIHLGDVDGKNEALVYAVSMRGNVWTEAARLRAGDTVEMELVPWSSREKEYGIWSRSEFEDGTLLLATPCFGTLVKK